MASVTSALTVSSMVGAIFPGNEPRELAGPAHWLDGVPFLVEPVTSVEGNLEIGLLSGMTSDGILVGWTGLDDDPMTPPSILVLRPTT